MPYPLYGDSPFIAISFYYFLKTSVLYNPIHFTYAFSLLNLLCVFSHLESLSQGYMGR